MKRRLSLFLAVVFVLGMTLQVSAAETRNGGSLGNCYLSISIQPNGVGLSYIVNFTETASEIGSKDIVLQEYVNGSWRNISIPSKSTTNSNSFAGSGVYTGAVKGRSYRAHCTHYAKYGGVTYTLYSETDTLVYN